MEIFLLKLDSVVLQPHFQLPALLHDSGHIEVSRKMNFHKWRKTCSYHLLRFSFVSYAILTGHIWCKHQTRCWGTAKIKPYNAGTSTLFSPSPLYQPFNSHKYTLRPGDVECLLWINEKPTGWDINLTQLNLPDGVGWGKTWSWKRLVLFLAKLPANGSNHPSGDVSQLNAADPLRFRRWNRLSH